MPRRPTRTTRTAAGLLSGLALLPALAAVPGVAAAADLPRVVLRVLVVSDGSPSVEAITTQLDREGVPYDRVAVGAADRPTIDAAFLSEPATRTAKYQAVVLQNASGGGLSADEVSALAAYEQVYGVREVDAYLYPGADVGLTTPAYAGPLDGAQATVTSAGRADGFGYLKGALTLDDADPVVPETWGYLSSPSTTLPAGESFTPLLTVAAGGTTGVLAGVHAAGGRERLVLTAGYNSSMQWSTVVGPGLVGWMTRGVHLGLQRNWFAVHVDDVLLPDSRWSVRDDCTPGDGCVDPAVTTPDIRMVPADVTRLVAWQKARGAKLDLAFNGGGSEAWKAEHGGADPLAAALLAAQARFSWINHTYTHPFLGCIQVAPTVQGQPWTCATTPDAAPRQDADVPQDASGGTWWASQAFLTAQVADNTAWATRHGLSDFDSTELVTGEHSGLRTLPNQPVDNPFLASALAAAGVRTTASDASRESASRPVGGAVTLPRHPMNVFYNAATYQEEVDEYNRIYTARADGGSGLCEDDPATSTCIAPLPSATAAQAKASFDRYVQPLEVRNALRHVLANDPRPFYAHQSNLAEDGLLYPVVDGVLDAYAAVYDTASTPLVRADMTTQAQALARSTAWRQSTGASAWVDATGVHVAPGSTAVPLTVPSGSRVSGATLQAYAGQLSGWVSKRVDVATPVVSGGYTGVTTLPSAPKVVTTVPGDGSATLTWTAPVSNGGTPVTGYRVQVYRDGVLVGAVPATGTTTTVSGLLNGTAYVFDVAAVNAVGTGPASARTNAVRPLPAGVVVPGAPTEVVAAPVGGLLAGLLGTKTSAYVSWSAPVGTGGSPLTAYRITAQRLAADGSVAGTTSSVTGTTRLTLVKVGQAGTYRFTVAAKNLAGFGAESPASAPVRLG